MRIVHYLEYLNLECGGPVRATLDLCKALAEQGHRVVYFTRDDVDAPPEWRGTLADDVAQSNGQGRGKPVVIRLPGDPKAGGLLKGEQKTLAQQIVKGADAVHLHGIWKLDNIQIARMARQQGTPYIVSLRGMLDDWSMAQAAAKKRVFHMLLGKRHLENAAAVHCTAEGERLQSHKWFPNGRAAVLPNLLDLNPYRNAPGAEQARAKFGMLSNGRPNVLFLSRVHYKKGVEVLIRAAALLRDRKVECNTIIAGTGDVSYISQMTDMASEHDLDDRILFTGHVGGTLKVSLYQAATVFALPTSQENFGFVFPEALASGTPVVTTKGVDIWPELEASGASLIVERTPEAFADAIEKIITNPELRAQMSSLARPFVFEAYDEKKLIAAYEGLYKGLK